LWTALLINVVTILISRSATSLLALAAGTAVMVMLAWVRMRLVGVITAAVLALILLVPWQFDVFGLVGRSADLTGRVPIWQTIIAATGAVRLSGLGMGVSPDLEPYLGAVIPHAHNGYIQVVVELGILGLVFFGILLVSTIRGVARRGGSTAVGALVFFLTANVANNYLIAPTLLALLFGWLMGMAIRPHGGPPATAPMRSHRPYRSRRTHPDAH
jgi:O-antigen ligase